MNDGIGLAEALLGLSGFRVLEVTETDAEVVIDIETPEDTVGCGGATDPTETDADGLHLGSGQ